MSKGKGFQRKKAPTKGELVKGQGAQLEQQAKLLQGLQQFVFQSNQQFAKHLQQLQRQVDELSNLVRLKQTDNVAKYDDWVVVDLLARAYSEDGASVSDQYIQELTTLGTSFRLEQEFTFFPTLVENLVGKKPGENICVDCVIPDNYPAEVMRGKKIQLDVSLINTYTPEANNTRLGEVKTKIDAQVQAKKAAEAEAAKKAAEEQAAAEAQATETTEEATQKAQ